MYTQGDFNVQLQSLRKTRVKIEVLNMDGLAVNEIQGLVVSGSININNSSLVRRTIDIQFVAEKMLEISPMSMLWINKRLRIYIGLEDYFGETYWYNMGTYVLSDPTTDVSTSGRFISIKGYDKMYQFERPFLLDVKFAVDTPISEVIKGIGGIVGETNFILQDDGRVLPYDLQFDIGSSIISALQDIVNLYMDYEMYVDVNGYLIYQKIKNRNSDPVMWDFSDTRMDFTISRSKMTDYSNVKNYVKCIGRLDDDGILPVFEKELESTHPFSKQNIGFKPLVFEESKYVNDEMCKSKVEYELEKAEKMMNRFNIECVPIYLLHDVNTRITVVDNGVKYECVIDSISFTLDGKSMSIQAHEITN